MFESSFLKLEEELYLVLALSVNKDATQEKLHGRN